MYPYRKGSITLINTYMQNYIGHSLWHPGSNWGFGALLKSRPRAPQLFPDGIENQTSYSRFNLSENIIFFTI